MMISKADFEELFPDDDESRLPDDAVPGLARTFSNRDAAQPLHDPLQAANTLAMMSPFGAAMAMMSAFGTKART